MHQTADTIVTMLRDAEDELRQILPRPLAMTTEEARRVIAGYTAAIAGNFVPWLAAGAVTVRSVHARFACEENILVEMQQNHSGLLEAFADAAHAAPEAHDYARVASVVEEMRVLIARLHGLEIITVLAGLEYLSRVFIPLLEDMARACGTIDLRYTQLHGIADAQHAEQFCWAWAQEAAHYDDAVQVSKNALTGVVRFCKVLFLVTP